MEVDVVYVVFYEYFVYFGVYGFDCDGVVCCGFVVYVIVW